MSVSVKRLSAFRHFSFLNTCSISIDEKKERTDHFTSTAPNKSSAHKPRLGLFSFEGLEHLRIAYSPSKPLAALFSPTAISNILCVTTRLLQLFQIVALSRLVWGTVKELRNTHSRGLPRGLKAYQENLEDIKLGHELINELHFHFTQTQVLCNNLLHFTADRVRCAQTKLSQEVAKLADSNPQMDVGFGRFVEAYLSYTASLQSSTFSEPPVENTVDSQMQSALDSPEGRFEHMTASKINFLLDMLLECLQQLWVCSFVERGQKLRTDSRELISLQRLMAKLANGYKDLMSILAHVGATDAVEDAQALLVLLGGAFQ